jgi:hypothetical protein
VLKKSLNPFVLQVAFSNTVAMRVTWQWKWMPLQKSIKCVITYHGNICPMYKKMSEENGSWMHFTATNVSVNHLVSPQPFSKY